MNNNDLNHINENIISFKNKEINEDKIHNYSESNYNNNQKILLYFPKDFI